MRLLFGTMFLFFLLQACTTPAKIMYFQDAKQGKSDTSIPLLSHTLQPHDIVQITVSSLNQEADKVFNTSQLNFQLNPAANTPAQGFLVDSTGEMDLPYLGNIKVVGMTTLQLKHHLKEKLRPILQEPAINIRVVNFKISVLGEVGKPGSFIIPVERITLPEAMSLAGDITIYGKRDNVLVVREKNGIREYARIDMKKTDWFTSPYYYLQANDLVYVEQAKTKLAQADASRFQLFTLITSVFSLAAIIITRVN